MTHHPAVVPLKQIEHGFGYVIIRSPYTPYSIYLSGTVFSAAAEAHRILKGRLAGRQPRRIRQERQTKTLSPTGYIGVTQGYVGLYRVI